ncbi:MAG: FAD-dependent oxidoreductase [Sphingomicrobium sp.]|nr:FAD-dependent oxidoreductase [Sphingomonadales bacterium]
MSDPSDKSDPAAVSRRSLLGGMAAGTLASPAIGRASVRGSKFKVAVIGAGVFGVWTARHLQQAGHKVTLIDARGPANNRASSGGESRLTRAAYGKDAIYTRMALDSLTQWKALSSRAGLPIFIPAGVLFFFPNEDAYLTDSLAAHRKLGLPTEALSRAEMARRFPMIAFDGIAAGLHEPGFGALMARRAVQLLAREFVADGGRYLLGSVSPPDEKSASLDMVTLSNGERIGADRFVFAAGPWLPKLFPQAIGQRIVPTRQEVFFFAPPPGDRRFQLGTMPGWADFNGGDIFYGFPDLESRGVKFAHDAHGVDVDPDTQSRVPTEAALAEIVAFRDHRFPLLRGAPLVESRVCQYENSGNGDFLIDHHPRLANVLLVGAGSGHGFKHGPEVGRRAAALVMGTKPAEPRFQLATKTLSQRREVH